MRERTRYGFTLVELLVVVAIIGILLALLLPAVQAVREASRRVKCQNHLRQIGVAMLSHHDSLQRFPTGGWGFVWVGDPDRGTGLNQPGGWVYNILSYVEQSPLRELGKGRPPDEKATDAVTLAQSPVQLFVCPSRRTVAVSPYSGLDLRNSAVVTQGAKTDYAANAGDVSCGGPGPANLEEGDSSKYDWGSAEDATGVLYKHSAVSIRDIRDGATHTYLIGEKRCNTQKYDRGDDQHMYTGHGFDTARYATLELPPTPDGPEEGADRFGSAHTGGCYFLFGDGSVGLVSYQIDPEIHRRQGNRQDGLSTLR